MIRLAKIFLQPTSGKAALLKKLVHPKQVNQAQASLLPFILLRKFSAKNKNHGVSGSELPLDEEGGRQYQESIADLKELYQDFEGSLNQQGTQTDTTKNFPDLQRAAKLFSLLSQIARPLFQELTPQPKQERRQARLNDFEEYLEYCRDAVELKMNIYYSLKDQIAADIEVPFEVIESEYEALNPENRQKMTEMFNEAYEGYYSPTELTKGMETETKLEVVDYSLAELDLFKREFVDFYLDANNFTKLWEDGSNQNTVNLGGNGDQPGGKMDIGERSIRLLDLNFALDYWLIDARFDQFGIEFFDFRDIMYQLESESSLEGLSSARKEEIQRRVSEFNEAYFQLKDLIMKESGVVF